MASHALRLAGFAALLLAAAPVGAADLVAPWDPGWSNLEVYLAVEEGSATTASGVVGYGAGRGVSLGVSFVEGEDDGDDVGLIAVLTRPLGRAVEADLWLEIGQRLRPREAELTSACVTAGVELSRLGPGAVPYLRLSAARDEGTTTVHPLLGVMLPLRERLELHLELSSEEPEDGPWPVHVAIGPNVLLGRSAKLVPELSWIRVGDGGSVWGVSVGIVFDPGCLRR